MSIMMMLVIMMIMMFIMTMMVIIMMMMMMMMINLMMTMILKPNPSQACWQFGPARGVCIQPIKTIIYIIYSSLETLLFLCYSMLHLPRPPFSEGDQAAPSDLPLRCLPAHRVYREHAAARQRRHGYYQKQPSAHLSPSGTEATQFICKHKDISRQGCCGL